MSPYIKWEGHERVIAVPFFSPSGKVVVKGPEELPSDRRLVLEPGHYRLVAAQRVVSEDEEQIDFYFQQLDKLAPCSEILVADDDLDPPVELLEEAEIAGV
ncbi:MAG: hypothetical protein MN733_21395 [Nitrososphaera sp.]|nr:hypothetical protein [Nitrososphaera sp.]